VTRRDQAIRQRAERWRRRARELAEQAAQEPYEHRRRHMLHLAATHQRAADKMARSPPDSTKAAVREDGIP
jgi:hypothetical protein